MNNFDRADLNFSFIFFCTEMADKMTKFCMDIYWNFEKSGVLNIIAVLQIPKILEICYLYN
jgi:hypothetical protein